jgi:hypothetical protein
MYHGIFVAKWVLILCILYPGLAYKMCNKKKISDELKNVTFTQTKDISGFNEMRILFVILIK